ncbi:MAG TPA: N-acetyltransferase [Micromonosporaceae bacterium]
MATLRLRPEGPADPPAIRRIVAAAFAGTGVAVPAEVALVDGLRRSNAWLPELSMVAEADGELVAYALLSRVWVGPGAEPALALGPVAVLPERHGRGYGTDVVQAALDAAVELGERLVVVLGNPSYYRRFGFRPAAELGLASPWSGLGDPWQALVLANDTSGAPPPPCGEVRYPAAWAAV